MSKFFKKIGKILWLIIDSIYQVIDKIIIMPISRIVYNLNKTMSANNISFNKLLNRPQFLIIISLIFSVICFFLIDNKVISLVNTEAERIKNVPVKLVYNEEAFVVENVPETVDITIAGRKSDIYLAKQLGEFEVELNLSKYTEAGTYKVYFTCSEAIDSVDYILDPSYLTVTIKDKVSEVQSVTYDLVGTDDLDPKLSVDSVTLDSNEVIVKGSQDRIDEISSIKALVSLADESFTEEGTYELTSIPLVAYDNNGEIVKNVEIVPNTLTGTLVLNSYHTTVPISVLTTGKLVNGKSIASISINGNTSYSVDIYGEEEEIKEITSVPVYINVDGMGSESAKNYTVVISKPNGVRYISTKNATIAVTFGDETQKTLEMSEILKRNVPEGYTATLSSVKPSVQVKGVASNINSINDIKGYVDLAGLGEGTHQVEVKIENTNPLVNYEVSATVNVIIRKE